MQGYLLQFDADTDEALYEWTMRIRLEEYDQIYWNTFSNGTSADAYYRLASEYLNDEGIIVTPEEVKQFCEKTGL